MELSADLPAPLVPLAWLIGSWAGAGVGGYPSVEEFRFGQEVVFEHDARPFLTYSSRTWLLDDEGAFVRPLATESGFWRPQPDGALEVTLSHPTGFTEIWIGTVEGARIELRTDVVARTTTSKEYTAGHRLYGLVEGDLAWAFDMAAVGQTIQPHVSARLKRVG
ncbi:MAG TPA: FABP family protein [Candidatus Limnocylindria bacterium]|nr:FABP family protein [Candidatus Limnocylindria bacterium]